MSRTSVDEVAADLEDHVRDCVEWRKRVSQHLDEAKEQREDMAADIKQLVAVMHHSKGFLRALVWVGVIGAAVVSAAAWVADHWHGFWK